MIIRTVSIIILMQLSGKKLTVVRKGCNSEIILWEQPEVKVILKAVPEQCLKESKHLQNQWKILSKLSHDNVVEVYRSRKDVILPGKEGVRLIWKSTLIPTWQETTNTKSTVNLLGGCTSRQLHSQDIKPENILITDHQEGVTAKLADFGFATRLQEDQHMIGSYKGTRRGYMAPEIHQCREDPTLRYDPKASDIFALGVVLFAIIMGKLPFEFATKEDRLYSLLAEGKSKQFWNSHVSQLLKLSEQQSSLIQEFKDLFQNMVTIKPQERLTIEQVLTHPWVCATKNRPQP